MEEGGEARRKSTDRPTSHPHQQDFQETGENQSKSHVHPPPPDQQSSTEPDVQCLHAQKALLRWDAKKYRNRQKNYPCPFICKKTERCPQNSPSKALSVRFDVDTVEHTRPGPDPQHRATEITHELAANIPQHLNRD